MLSLFQRKRASVAAAASPGPTTDLPKGLTRPETAASLLATPRRQKLLEHIWQRTSLSRQQFDTLYRTPLERYAALVQQFPASESHHHAYHGGMLDHGLEIVAYALKLRQSYLLPAGATPEDQAAQAEAWTAATAYAALLHDIGKIAVDLHVEQADGSVWHPWHGPLKQPYRFRYREDREYRLHSAATGLLYHQVIDRFILDWLSGFPSLWAALLYIMAGQYEHAGVLGELVIKADRASVAQELGGDPAKAMAAPKHALQRKLLDGLRYLLKEELKLNQPQASDGWLTHDALWLVSKTVSDKLRAHLLSQGIDGIPANNSAVFNVLQEHSMLQPAPDGKAIWRATVTSSSGWSHAFTLLRLSPALIWDAGERPAAYAGTVLVETGQGAEANGESAPDLLDSSMQDTADDRANPPLESKPSLSTQPVAKNAPDMMDELLAMIGAPDPPKAVDQGNSSSQPTPEAPGKPHQVSEFVPAKINPISTSNHPSRDESNGISTQMSADHFVTWLQQAIASRRLVINDAKALVHIVADAVYLVSPGVFQRYAQEHPQIADYAKREEMADWQWAQKRFEKLHLHRKQANGLNIWMCEVTGPRKSRRLHGYLLERWQGVFGELPPNNPYLKLREVASDATIEADYHPRATHN
ncbi:TraI domain-containing protein [Xanthomonas campestris pv. campestris]|uniref:MobH family relaxase n=1 Tax=Xanthomonas campestris TaxID=339 RepID=UPI001E2DA761|nr:MobH family relaxase [Xanthomonas campestris]MCD0252740.1 TraI domain-containing protein [Xanthomonas campestris pv. campestris]MEB1303175.1 MobH family relaxase [Xanthomonas campestris pv. campestris]MEB1311850.1 MobH family relaxase [Xanthomonas campestris pv. campestris]MEB1336864.1 MobH family relaxase [Xanthomonas campestris pv. campestris]MEB1902745.1 MobH family relaxase [Xanthomonas campestris pv. campestris]